MLCQRCKHNNPAGARFCNHCGQPQDADLGEETSLSGPAPLLIPIEVRGSTVRIRRSLFETADAARAAMTAAGFEVQEALTRVTSFEGVGELTRVYGVLGNAFSDEEEVTDAAVPTPLLGA